MEGRVSFRRAEQRYTGIVDLGVQIAGLAVVGFPSPEGQGEGVSDLVIGLYVSGDARFYLVETRC